MEGRVPPHNLEAERSVIGSVLVDQSAFAKVEGLINADSFYKEAHRKIWRAIERLVARGQPVDLVTLAEELDRSGELDEVGGRPYLVGLSEDTPTAAFVEHYARIVAEKASLRRLIAAAGEIMRRAYEQEDSLEAILDEASKRIVEVLLTERRQEASPLDSLVHEAFEHIQKLHENQGVPRGVKTGFRDLDALIGALEPGSLNIIAARPSMGKTAFALTIAQHAAIKEKIPVGIFSLEMPALQLATRILASEARVDMNRLRRGALKDHEFQWLADAAGRVAEAPIYIDDTPDLSLMELRAKARRLAARHHIGLIVVDYLQLMSGPSGSSRGENRQQEIAAISRGLKSLARELDVPVIALSQLSRAVESRPNKRPMLSDLRESGSIEQDADLVLFIFREAYYKDEPDADGVAEIIVGKHRNGPTGKVRLQFHSAYVRFHDLAPEEGP